MNDSNTPSPDPVGMTIDRVLEILQNGDIEDEQGLMRWSSNYAFLVMVKCDDTSLPAVYKPQRGERPLWDFPDGSLCNREQASFLTSQELGWLIVPPTVLREGPHGLGSEQFYIDHDPEENYFSFDESKLPYIKTISAFDYLVNNADRKGGHCLVDSQGHVWGIDHGITFHSQNKLRTVIWDLAGEPLDNAHLADIERLCGRADDSSSTYRKALSKLLTDREINAFQNRIRHLLKTKKYPQPGPSGPNWPWPPV